MGYTIMRVFKVEHFRVLDDLDTYKGLSPEHMETSLKFRLCLSPSFGLDA